MKDRQNEERGQNVSRKLSKHFLRMDLHDDDLRYMSTHKATGSTDEYLDDSLMRGPQEAYDEYLLLLVRYRNYVSMCSTGDLGDLVEPIYYERAEECSRDLDAAIRRARDSIVYDFDYIDPVLRADISSLVVLDPEERAKMFEFDWVRARQKGASLCKAHLDTQRRSLERSQLRLEQEHRKIQTSIQRMTKSSPSS